MLSELALAILFSSGQRNTLLEGIWVALIYPKSRFHWSDSHPIIGAVCTCFRQRHVSPTCAFQYGEQEVTESDNRSATQASPVRYDLNKKGTNRRAISCRGGVDGRHNNTALV